MPKTDVFITAATPGSVGLIYYKGEARGLSRINFTFLRGGKRAAAGAKKPKKSKKKKHTEKKCFCENVIKYQLLNCTQKGRLHKD